MGRERFLFVPFPLPCGSALGILTYPVGRVGVIHPSAWNRNSANFAFWAFSEVHIPALCVVLCRASKLWTTIQKIQIIRTGCIMAPERIGAPDPGAHKGLRTL
jgi:hypothetical protein